MFTISRVFLGSSLVFTVTQLCCLSAQLRGDAVKNPGQISLEREELTLLKAITVHSLEHLYPLHTYTAV